MKNFEILEHTADLKIRAYGKDLPELFANMARGMFESIGPKIKEGPKAERKIKVESGNVETLLVDFLNELLFQSDTNNEAYFTAKFDKLTETELEGEIIGQKIEGFKEEIKAVTYHGLEVRKINNLWRAIVIFDV